MSTWVGDERIAHLDGVPWWEAPPPPRQHEHTPQTRGARSGNITFIERCACGAVRLDRVGPWVYGSEREEQDPRVQPEPVRRKWWRRS